MSNIQSIVNSLMVRAAKVDPVMLSILQEITNELSRIGFIVDPAPVVATKLSSVTQEIPESVVTFTYTLTLDNVILSWEAPTTDFVYYEIRKGATWDTADYIATVSSLQVYLDPLAVGTHTYLIKTLNEGTYSTNAASVDVIIPALGTVSVTSAVIGNFIQLSWTEPSTTFRIDYYQVLKDGIIIADDLDSRFFARQEALGGTFEYSVIAYDIVGNASPESIISVGVASPTDFDFEDSMTSTFTGTIVNGKVEDSRLYVCINNTETYQQHFDNNLWGTPQDQVSSEYIRWLSPFLTTASYQEIFDFGEIYSAVIVNINYLFELIAGSFTFGLEIEVSDDGISYSAPFTSNSFFTASVRYVRAKINFTAGNDKAILALFNLVISLNVRREVDGGEVAVFAADASGTVVTFNKAFKFVESITITPLQTNVRTWTYDFAGGSNPTTFKVFLWDSAGTRVDGTISWKSRGVI